VRFKLNCDFTSFYRWRMEPAGCTMLPPYLTKLWVLKLQFMT